MLSRKTITVITCCAASILLLVLAGCGSGSGDKPSVSPVEGPQEIVSVYKANCVSCHGTGLQGRVGPATDLRKVGARMSAADITKQIEEGEGSMPAFQDRLTAEEITGLADWLASKK
ncbi:c-type cytochrome [Paenibacillus sinopodophylli]|uniref:c-type cytochrome n=1 Tax=Paenibacillus sinopodophylli TaxID=1837342 RepID=UPI00110CCE52|nr:cytochrome c [Paenibacillus sinopodophylli]